MSEYAFVEDPVVRAVCQEDAAKVRELATAGASLDEADSTLGVPVFAAVQNEDHDMLALLLELGANPNGPNVINWETPLSQAAENRDVRAVELLLDKGADPNRLQCDGSPLMGAIAAGDVKIAKMLLDAGADVFATNSHGVNPANSLDLDPPGRAMVKLIHAAAKKAAAKANLADAARFGATERVRELAATAEVTALREAAGLAVENDQADVLQVLLGAGVEPDAVVPLSTTIHNRMPLLHLAVHLEHDAVIEVLLAAGGADPNLQAKIAEGTVFEEAGVTPLMIAAKDRKLARVKTLIAAGADPQARNRQGETALALARKAGRKPIVKYLETLTAKQAATVGESAEAAISLHDAVRDGRLNIVQTLLDGGADVNAVEGEGRTPLMEAIDHDHPEMLDLLLQRGADPCIVWPRGHSTWSMAMRQRSAMEMARLLLTAVDDPRKLVTCQPPEKDPAARLWTALFDTEKGAGTIVKLLLDHGLNPNERFADGFTPLLCGAVHGRAKSIEAVHVLLEAGADPRAVKQPDPDRLELNRQVAEAFAKRRLKYTPDPEPEEQPQLVLDLARRHSKKVYQVLRDHLGAELDACDRADVALAGLKTAATQPWFTELADEVAEKLGCKPRPWKRRAGVLHLSAKLGRLPKPDDLDEDDAEEIAELLRLEPLQQWVRQRGASLVYVESASDARHITRLLLAPTTDWIALLQMCGTNGANYGLRTRDIVTWLAEKAEQHPFELQGCGHDFVAIRFTEPIDDYEALHAAIESFCPDTSGEGPAAPAELKDFYANDRRCFFWWD